MTGTFHRTLRPLGFAAIGAGVLLAALYAPTGAFHVLPFSVTGEADRLAALLDVEPGRAVADIGAGRGAMTVEMAGRVGPNGRVYSTEISAERRADITARAARQRLGNVLVVEAGASATNLPDACCDSIFLRNVYHHIVERGPFLVSLRRSIRNGGRLAVIDFEPDAFWHLPGRAAGAPEERTGHGVSRARLVAEVSAAGFQVEREIAHWGGGMFLVLFRARPLV